MRYKITKNLAGAYAVKFDCPGCQLKLSEALKRAGQPDFCPECGAQFKIPGEKELAELQAKAQRQAEAKAAAKAARQEEREQAAAAQQAEREQAAAAKQAEREQAAAAQQLQQQDEEKKRERMRDASGTIQPVQRHSLSESSRTRYPALYIYQTVLRAIGYGVLLLGILLFCGSIYQAMSSGSPAVVLSAGITMLFGAIGIGFAFLFTSELIRVILDIEVSTRVTSMNSAKMVSRSNI